MAVEGPACVRCGAPRSDGGPPTCEQCGAAGRIISATAESKITATATASATIATVLWSLWARRAYKEHDDARAAARSTSPADALPAIAFAIAGAAFALDGVTLDLERPHGGPKQHPAAPSPRPRKHNRGDYVAAVILDEVGRMSDAARWQDRAHALFDLRHDFAAHPETVAGRGPVSPARAALTMAAEDDAVALLRDCLSALHAAGRMSVPDDLR